MRTFRFGVLGFVLIFCLLTWISSYNVEASEYLGEFCWEYKEDGMPAGILKLGVSHIGGEHYLLSGRANSYGGEKMNILHGNAEIEGSNIMFTAVCSGKHDDEAMWTWTGHGVLNISTLNGTVEIIGHDRNYLDLSIDTEYNIVTLTFISCP